jgi:hypothetical protein
VIPLIAVGAAASIIFAQALATARVEPIRIAYHAPARCPDEGRFLGEVFARTALARSAVEGEAAREFAVDITDGAGGSLSGSLEIHSADGSASRRGMVATRCDELVSALALMVALAVDPEGASSTPLSASSAPPQNPSPDGGAPATWSTQAPLSNTAPTPMAAPAPPSATAPIAPPVRERAADTAPRAGALGDENAAPEPPEPRHGHWSVGAEGLVLLALLPIPAVGGSATLDYDFAPSRASSAGLRFALSAVTATPAFKDRVHADVFRAWAQVEGCPFRLRLARSIHLTPCVGLDAGVLRSQGSGLAQTAPTDVRSWFAVEAGIHLESTFAAGWLARAGLGALAPFERSPIEYVDQSSTQTYTPWPVGLSAELGVARWLP